MLHLTFFWYIWHFWIFDVISNFQLLLYFLEDLSTFMNYQAVKYSKSFKFTFIQHLTTFLNFQNYSRSTIFFQKISTRISRFFWIFEIIFRVKSIKNRICSVFCVNNSWNCYHKYHDIISRCTSIGKIWNNVNCVKQLYKKSLNVVIMSLNNVNQKSESRIWGGERETRKDFDKM